ncbi:sporulation protein YjcZ [Paenibacillus etheri]|nr:sporulation protein YjcZ [Paenibacillus etheri]
MSGCGQVGGAFTNTSAILVLFILLVIISCACMF